MKTKDGQIKLGKHDHRVGNFVFTLESEGKYVKIHDINRIFTLRYDATTSQGVYLKYLIEEKADNALSNFISVMFNTCLVVPDVDYLMAINASAVECMKRHPELYGVFDPDKPDEEIVQDQKDIQEFLDSVPKDVLDN